MCKYTAILLREREDYNEVEMLFCLPYDSFRTSHDPISTISQIPIFFKTLTSKLKFPFSFFSVSTQLIKPIHMINT
jgi:hypothetical protein